LTVFADTNALIYLIEQPATFGARAAAYFSAVFAAGDRVALSELVRMECRVGPLTTSDTAILAEYESFFESSKVDVLPITRAICDRASAIRAQFRFRSLDALHLAAAVENRCDRFLTNDLRLKSFPDIAVEVLP
jgi:uncharacterized protein